MPKSPNANLANRNIQKNSQEGMPPVAHKSTSNSPSVPSKDQDCQQHPSEFEEDFFDKRSGKKRSLTDEFHKFNTGKKE